MSLLGRESNVTTKVAILLDGGYYLKRLPSVRRDVDPSDPKAVAESIGQLVKGHLQQINDIHQYSNPQQLLYRCFFYNAWPYQSKAHLPISKKAIDYSKSDLAQFRTELLDLLRVEPNLALRMGEVVRPGDASWLLNEDAQKRILNGDLLIADLRDSDFRANLRQKGVDMRIGLDIASLTLKKLVSIIVLVSGDSDFVPAARLARREGVTVILDPLRQVVPPDLREHVDLLNYGFYNTAT